MLRPPVRHLPSPKMLSSLGRGLVVLQLLKETATIILLGLPLLWAQPLLVPAALPGVVLYVFRWAMVLGNVRRRGAVIVWLLTLIDELWGLAVYLRAVDAPTQWQLRYLNWSYSLGLIFTLAALLEIGWRRSREQARLRARQRALIKAA